MLQNLEVRQTKTVGRRKCIKVSPMANELKIDLITFLEGYFFFVEFFGIKAPLQANLYITSEENSYGAIMERWYDGMVAAYILKNGTQHFINAEVDEFHYLKSICQKQSFSMHAHGWRRSALLCVGTFTTKAPINHTLQHDAHI